MHHAETRCGYVGILLLYSQIFIRMNNVLALLFWQIASQQLYASDLPFFFEMVYSPLEFFHCVVIVFDISCVQKNQNFELFFSRFNNIVLSCNFNSFIELGQSRI